MARRQKKRSTARGPSRAPRPGASALPPSAGSETESRAVELVTILWSLSLVTTVAVELAAALVQLAVRRWPESARLQLLAGLLWFSAVVLGLGSTALLAVVCRVRRLPPSREAIGVSLLVCLAPPLFVVVRFLLGSA